MSNRNIIAGLDIGTNWIRLVVCEIRAGDNLPQILALVKKPSRGLRRGYIVDQAETAGAIREVVLDAERSLKFKLKKVVLGMGGVSLDSRVAEGVVNAPKPNSEIGESELNRAIEVAENSLLEMENRRVLHRLPLDFKVNNEKILGRPIGLTGSKLEVKTLFVTCLTQHLKDLVRATEEAGLIVDDVIASPLAASASALTKSQKMAGCVLLNIGSQTSSLAVFEEGRALGVQIFPLGSTDITNDIALGFRIPPEEAERVKKGEGEPVGTKKKLDEIIEARLSDIFEFAERYLKRLGVAGLLPAGLSIIGGGANIPEIEDLAKHYFKLPARLGQQNIATHSRSQIRDTAWATAYGLCLYTEEENVFSSGFNLQLVENIWKNIVSWVKEFMP